MGGKTRTAIVAATGTLIALMAAASALATFQPGLLYDPPLIHARDYQAHASVENVTVARSGNDIVVTNEPSPYALEPESDSGCESVLGGWACPVAGVDRLLVTLGDMPDTADVDLGGLARRVPAQIVRGGPGADDIDGGARGQRLAGGSGRDTLKGGPGDDLLVGGPGDDTCRGGPGRDVLRSC